MSNVKIDWDSKEFHILINPRTPLKEKNKLNELINHYSLDGHIFLTTSGSTSKNDKEMKWVALKKSGFLLSASSVNQHLNCTSQDIFLNTLPHFHVGGLSLWARAFLCGGKLVDIYNEKNKWNAKEFAEILKIKNATISSLVPTQVFDLVKQKIKAPSQLRFVVVGGGYLNKTLYEDAQKLNWPLLPSYGMSECCSQIATASPQFNWVGEYSELTVLPHVSLSINKEGNIEVQSESLLTGYILQTENEIKFIDVKINKKITTNDKGILKNNLLLMTGRDSESIKINGEVSSLNRLQALLQHILISLNVSMDCAVTALPDERKGHKIALVFEYKNKNEQEKINNIINSFNDQVYPFEKTQETYFIEKIPRTELGKLKHQFMSQLNQA